MGSHGFEPESRAVVDSSSAESDNLESEIGISEAEAIYQQASHVIRQQTDNLLSWLKPKCAALPTHSIKIRIPVEHFDERASDRRFSTWFLTFSMAVEQAWKDLPAPDLSWIEQFPLGRNGDTWDYWILMKFGEAPEDTFDDDHLLRQCAKASFDDAEFPVRLRWKLRVHYSAPDRIRQLRDLAELKRQSIVKLRIYRGEGF